MALRRYGKKVETVNVTPEYLPHSIKMLAMRLYLHCRLVEKTDQPTALDRVSKALCIIAATGKVEEDKRFSEAIKLYLLKMED